MNVQANGKKLKKTREKVGQRIKDEYDHKFKYSLTVWLEFVCIWDKRCVWEMGLDGKAIMEASGQWEIKVRKKGIKA